jgi:hypothetical protein
VAIWIHILCRARREITAAEIQEYVDGTELLDSPATFIPSRDSVDARDPTWSHFAMKYAAEHRPIEVRHWSNADQIRPTVEEIVGRLSPRDRYRELIARLGETHRAIVFVLPDDPPIDVWDALDAAEAWLAREWDGLVVAEEGIYDADLNLLAPTAAVV